MFNCCILEKSKTDQIKPKRMIKNPSTVTSFHVLQLKQVYLTETLPRKTQLPKPQNEPYWIVKRSGEINKYFGCKESLNEVLMGRIETEFFIKVDTMKQIKYWAVRKEAAYYHVRISCLRKRRSKFSFSMKQREIILSCLN